MTIVYCSSCNKTRLKPGHKTRISRKNGGVICNRCYQREKEDEKGKKGFAGTKHHPEPREGMLKI